MQILGKVIEVGTTVNVTEKFRKRDLIVEYAENPTYPEPVKFEAHNDTCDKLDELRAGDNITLDFNIKGRPWTDKNGKTAYFNTLAIWKFQLNKTVAKHSESVDISSAPEDDSLDLPF